MTFGEPHNSYYYKSFLYLPIGCLKWKFTYVCRGRFTDNLEYDWLVMMSFGGAVVNFIEYKVNPCVRALYLELWVDD